jgi:putative transposase
LEVGLLNYRRYYVSGGSFFFTVMTERRAGILANERARDYLREVIGYCLGRLPFHVDALVILPDHVHTIWTMPPNGGYSKRWGISKYPPGKAGGYLLKTQSHCTPPFGITA